MIGKKGRSDFKVSENENVQKCKLRDNYQPVSQGLSVCAWTKQDVVKE